MNSEVKEKWVADLRSGKYNQTTKNLKNANGYCCLGVLCEQQGVEWIPNEGETVLYYSYEEPGSGERHDGMPGPMILDWAGLAETAAEDLAQMNDDGDTFPVIADWIEQKL